MSETGLPAQPSSVDVADQLARLGRNLHGQGFVHGLNPAQWMALRYFNAREARDRTVMRFAGYYGSSRGTASQTITALVRKGYLARVPNPAKRSSRLLEVTPAGQRLLENDPQRHLLQALDDLPQDTLRGLSQAMFHLLRNLTAP